MTQVKVKFIRTDIEEIVEPGRLVWCPQPYELPCQSLFFALLKYREVADDINMIPVATSGTDSEAAAYSCNLESFRFVHLDNIRRPGAAPAEEPSPQP